MTNPISPDFEDPPYKIGVTSPTEEEGGNANAEGGKPRTHSHISECSTDAYKVYTETGEVNEKLLTDLTFSSTLGVEGGLTAEERMRMKHTGENGGTIDGVSPIPSTFQNSGCMPSAAPSDYVPTGANTPAGVSDGAGGVRRMSTKEVPILYLNQCSHLPEFDLINIV